MIKSNQKWNVKDLFEALQEKGLNISDSFSKDIIKEQQKLSFPFVLKLLVGLGALIASLLFCLFIFFAFDIIFENEGTLITLGCIFIILSTVVQRLMSDENPISLFFWNQIIITALVVGYLLLSLGAFEFLELWEMCLLFFIITCINYPFYTMPVGRFIMVLNVLCFTLVNIFISTDGIGTQEILYNIFILFQSIGLVILLKFGIEKPIYTPLLYALATSLLISLLWLNIYDLSDYNNKNLYIGVLFSNILMSAWLISLLYIIAGSVKEFKREPFIIASIGVLLLGGISASGIIFALGLMVFAYAKQEKALTALGIFSLILFIILYYYNLNISLLYKSFILTGSGVLLLIGRFYLKYKAWDKVNTSCE